MLCVILCCHFFCCIFYFHWVLTCPKRDYAICEDSAAVRSDVVSSVLDRGRHMYYQLQTLVQTVGPFTVISAEAKLLRKTRSYVT